MALALVLASLPSSEIGRGALPCSLACCVVGESERVSSLLRRRASRPQLTHLLHVLDESALHAVGGIEGELPVIRSLQALIRLLEELGAATDAAAPLRALASLIDAGSLRLIEPAAVRAPSLLFPRPVSFGGSLPRPLSSTLHSLSRPNSLLTHPIAPLLALSLLLFPSLL